MSNETAEQTAAPKSSGFSPVRLLGFAMIVAACVLYVRSYRAKVHSYEAAVSLSEAVRENGAIGVMVMHTLEGMDLPPILYKCDVDIATNLLERMSEPEPVKFPKGTIEGDLFVVCVVGTNKDVREFRAIRPAADPSNALVGRITREKGEDGKLRESVAQPALVKGAGDILGGILKDLVERGEKLSANPKFKEDFAKLLEKTAAEMKAEKLPEPEKPAEPAEAGAAEP